MQYPSRLLRDYCEHRLPRDVARSIEIAAAFDADLAVAISNERRRTIVRTRDVPLREVAAVAGYAF